MGRKGVFSGGGFAAAAAAAVTFGGFRLLIEGVEKR